MATGYNPKLTPLTVNYASLDALSSLGTQTDSIDGTVATDYFNGLSSSFRFYYASLNITPDVSGSAPAAHRLIGSDSRLSHEAAGPASASSVNDSAEKTGSDSAALGNQGFLSDGGVYSAAAAAFD